MLANAHVVDALWYLHPVIEVSLAGIMYRRKLHRQFPIFFAYILFQVVQFVILFPIFRLGDSTTYFFPYQITSVISLILGIKIIQEVFSDVFRPFPAFNGMGTLMFRWAAPVTGLLMFMLLMSSTGSDILSDGMGAAGRSVHFTQCALILFLLMFSRSMGVSWRQKSIGIALGYGWFAAWHLLLFTPSFVGIHYRVIGLLSSVAYSMSLIVWIVYIAFPASDSLPTFPNGPSVPVIDAGTF